MDDGAVDVTIEISRAEFGPQLIGAAKDISEAMRNELAAAREDPSRSFPVTDGKLIHEGESGFLYAFAAEVRLPLAPESPIGLSRPDGDSVRGMLVAVRDFDVVLELQENIGDEVPQAKVSSEPWFITEKARERLGELLEEDKLKTDLPARLLGLVGADGGTFPITEPHEPSEQLGLPPDLPFQPNQHQADAVSKCVSEPFHFVWGPPGTGKTANLAMVARGIVARGERVLVLAHANAAVDVAAVKIAAMFSSTPELSEGKILRYGTPQLPEALECHDMLPEGILAKSQPDLIAAKQNLEKRRREFMQAIRDEHSESARRELGRELQAVRDDLSGLREQFRAAVTELVRGALVLVTTLSRLVIDQLVWEWPADAVIIDETSMAPVPLVFLAASRAKKRMSLFGDLRQLAPIHRATTPIAESWLGRDSYEVAGVTDRIAWGEVDARVTMLIQQYRMSKEIAGCVSDLAYDGKLITPNHVDRGVCPIVHGEPWADRSVLVLDTSGLATGCVREARAGSYSRVNPLQAVLDIGLLARARALGLDDAAMITPYRAQARLVMSGIRRLALDSTVTAATVHRFQGSERDLVVLDLADADPQRGASMLTGTNAASALRLLTVSCSRPRGKLLIVADVEFILMHHPKQSPARRLLQLARGRGEVIELDAGAVKDAAHGGPLTWYRSWATAQRSLAKDVGSAMTRATINLPSGFEPDDAVRESVTKASISSRVTVFADPVFASTLEKSEADIRLMTLAGGFFALVDDDAAWVGGRVPEGPVARVTSGAFTRALSDALLGRSLDAPGPDADMEKALDKVCGRCESCGEARRPHRVGDELWALRCSKSDHPTEALDKPGMQRVVLAAGVHCPTCHGAANVHEKDGRLFLGCPGYRQGCPGKPPALEIVFGEG